MGRKRAALAVAGGLALALITAACNTNIKTTSDATPTAASSTPTTSATPEPSISSTTTSSPLGVAEALPEGDYVDGPEGTPHYVLTVSTATAGFVGWLYFLYQDGRTAVMFHYAARAQADGTFTFQTEAGRPPFDLDTANEGQAGSSPVPPGQTYRGGYASRSLVLSDCGTYLYWATPHQGFGPAQSCTFTYRGPTFTTSSGASDLRTVAWPNLTYPVDCGPASTQLFEVTYAEPAPGKFVALTLVSCKFGAGTPPRELLVYDNTGTASSPHLLQTLVTEKDDWLTPQGALMARADQVSLTVAGYSVPRYAPDVTTTLQWHWAGDKYQKTSQDPPHLMLPS